MRSASDWAGALGQLATLFPRGPVRPPAPPPHTIQVLLLSTDNSAFSVNAFYRNQLYYYEITMKISKENIELIFTGSRAKRVP